MPRIPQDWPGGDVNVEVWSMMEERGRRPPHATRSGRERYWRIRVTHRATGAVGVAVSRGGDGRTALAIALHFARLHAAAYERLGLGDLAAELRRAA